MKEESPWSAANSRTRSSARQGERLWEVWVPPSLHACELRDHGGFGVEAQILRDGQLVIGRRFDTRAEAVQWAGLVRGDFEKGGD